MQLDRQRLHERGHVSSTSDGRRARPCEGSLDQGITRATVDMTLEAGGCRISSSHVTSQIAFARVILEAAVVWTVIAFTDGVKVDVWPILLISDRQKNLTSGFFGDSPGCAFV